MRIAINGFGRIGRTFLRCILHNELFRESLDAVVINIGDSCIENVAHMFKYDTLMGTLDANVSMEKDNLIINDNRIRIITQLDPALLPWKEYDIEWVVDCTGKFTQGDIAQQHCIAGAKKVLISAPAHGEDIAIVPGVNEHLFDAQAHTIVSLGSCTTNAFMTMLKVLHDSFIISRGCMTTIHAYTNSQVLLDVEAKDLRFSRAAALNIIPAGTGASEMVEKIMPELKGTISAVALRVPVGKVSLIDFVFEAKNTMSTESLNQAFFSASMHAMKGIIGYTTEPLVSSDFSGNNHSVIIDSLLTNVQGNVGHVFGWYDNEWGYSMRMADFLLSTL